MRTEKSWRNTIFGGLAALVLGFAISGKKAEAADPAPEAKIEIVAGDENEFGKLIKTGLNHVDDGIDFRERGAAKANGINMVATEDKFKDLVLGGFRLRKDGNINLGWYKKEGGDLKLLGYDPDNAVMKAEDFKKLAKKVQELMVGMGGARAPVRAPVKPAAPAGLGKVVAPAAAKAVIPGLVPIDGKNGLEYAVETLKDGNKRLLVKMPGEVGAFIEPKEDADYSLNLWVARRGYENAHLEVTQHAGKDDTYTLVFEGKKQPIKRAVNLAFVKQIYAHIRTRDDFYARNADKMVDHKGVRVFKEDLEEAERLSKIEDNPMAESYTHSLAELRDMATDKNLSRAERRYLTNIVNELESNKRPDGTFFEEVDAAGSKLELPGPRSYAKLARHVKSKDPTLTRDKVQKAVDNLDYQVTIILGGRPEFHIVVKDGSEYVASFRHSFPDLSRRYGGNAEQTLHKALMKLGYMD
jgi:hypothetical protein